MRNNEIIEPLISITQQGPIVLQNIQSSIQAIHNLIDRQVQIEVQVSGENRCLICEIMIQYQEEGTQIIPECNHKYHVTCLEQRIEKLDPNFNDDNFLYQTCFHPSGCQASMQANYVPHVKQKFKEMEKLNQELSQKYYEEEKKQYLEELKERTYPCENCKKETKIQTDLVTLNDCVHQFCRDCVQGHCLGYLKDGNNPTIIKCLKQDCKIEQLVELDIKFAFDKIAGQYEIFNKQKNDYILFLQKEINEYPQDWVALPQKDNCVLQAIDLNSITAQLITRQMRVTVPNAHIVKIERVQNQNLWKLYSYQFGQVNQNVSKFLFHGTRAAKPELIYNGVNTGFDIQFANPGGSYGGGIYFSDMASYSQGYTHPSKDGNLLFFLAEVLVGNIHIGPGGAHKNPPAGFDSIRSQAAEGQNMYIVYSNNRAYPQYLIEWNVKTNPPLPLINDIPGDQSELNL